MGKGERFIFVGGCPRSGTTLVQNVLDSHPHIFGGPEMNMLSTPMKLRKRMHEVLSRECGYYDEAAIDDIIRSFIEQILLPIADKNSSRFISEKSPYNITVFEDLAEVFPDARLIFVVRDPRGVVSSMIQLDKRAEEKISPSSSSLFQMIDITRSLTECGFKALKACPGRIYLLKYENLLLDPERETKRLCEFLNVPWSPEMLKPGHKQHTLPAYVRDGKKLIWHDLSDYAGFHPERTTKWDKELSSLEKALLRLAFKDHPDFLSLGYKWEEENLIFSVFAKLLRMARSFFLSLNKATQAICNAL